MKEFYIDVSTNLLYDIRLCIEGAVVLYENDAISLRRLALENDMLAAANAFDTIGAALYELLHDIRQLHEAHIKESVANNGVKSNNC